MTSATFSHISVHKLEFGCRRFCTSGHAAFGEACCLFSPSEGFIAFPVSCSWLFIEKDTLRYIYKIKAYIYRINNASIQSLFKIYLLSNVYPLTFLRRYGLLVDFILICTFNIYCNSKPMWKVTFWYNGEMRAIYNLQHFFQITLSHSANALLQS